MSFLFGQPSYSYPSPYTAAYASPYRRSYYEGDGNYLGALAAEREQRAREEYIRAAVREREARRQEQEYRRALALEQQRHEAALREIAQRDASRQHQRQRAAAPLFDSPYPTRNAPELPARFPQPSYQYSSSPFSSYNSPYIPRGSRVPIVDYDAPFVEEPQPLPRRNPPRESVYDAYPNSYLNQGSDEDLGRKLVLHLDKAPTPEQIKQVKDILSGDSRNAPINRPQPAPREDSFSSTRVQPAKPEPQEQSSLPEPIKLETEKDEDEEPTVDETSSNPASPAQAFSAISSIERDFHAIKDAFTFPETLDFTTPTKPGNAPQLTYSSINLPLRVHEQQLTNLLTKLDEVDSGGLQSVRDARKKLVNEVEAALEEMDRKKIEAGERFIRSLTPTETGELVVEAEAEAESTAVAEPIADGFGAGDAVMEPADTTESPSSTQPETIALEEVIVEDHDVPAAEVLTEPLIPEVAPIPELVAANEESMDVSQTDAPGPSADLSLPAAPLEDPDAADVTLAADEFDDQVEDLQRVEQELGSDFPDSTNEEDTVVLTVGRDSTLEAEEVDHSDHGSDYEML